MIRTRRMHDLVLVGATGFVGRLAAQHLARYAPPDARIALAGRSQERLEAVRAELGGTAASWPLLVVDISDDAAVADLAVATKVVVSTVGPYLRHGLPLVRACAEAGTDYADITGETLFVRRTIDAAHEQAVATGARIVHACGFDSVPSDLAVGLCARQAAADGEGSLTQTVLHVRSMRGGLSGGTIASGRQQLVEMSADRGARALAGRADALVDGPETPGVRRPGRPRPIRRDPGSGHWQAPFVMGVFNRQIVHRSNALSHAAYGPEFRYREVVDTGRGVRGALGAAALTGGLAAFAAGMSFAPTRAVLDRVLPAPGSGPSEQTMQRGRFAVEVVTTTTTGARYRTRIGADKDPGYGATAVMLGESALALAFDEVPLRGGVLTPMVALDGLLVARLRAHGFTIETERL